MVLLLTEFVLLACEDEYLTGTVFNLQECPGKKVCYFSKGIDHPNARIQVAFWECMDTPFARLQSKETSKKRDKLAHEGLKLREETKQE